MKPSVTKLIEQLDKPALLKWANKLGLQGVPIDDYKGKAREDGSNIHEAIENFLKFKILSDNEDLNQRMIKFFQDKEIIEVEGNIECEYYQGRFDVKLKWQGWTFICDFKSNSKIYFETKLQLAAYKLASQCDHVAVIHLPELLIRPVSLELELYNQFLIHLSGIFELRNKLDSYK
jgi:hypothetical protein